MVLLVSKMCCAVCSLIPEVCMAFVTFATRATDFAGKWDAAAEEAEQGQAAGAGGSAGSAKEVRQDAPHVSYDR